MTMKLILVIIQFYDHNIELSLVSVACEDHVMVLVLTEVSN